MKKLVAVAAAALFLVLTARLALPSAASPPDVVAARPGVAAAQVTAQETGQPDPVERSPGDEAATQRESATPGAAGRIVEGRIVYASTGQPVPFAAVRVRDGERSESLRADRDGHFATRKAWPTSCQLAFESAVVGLGNVPGNVPSQGTWGPMVKAPLLFEAERPLSIDDDPMPAAERSPSKKLAPHEIWIPRESFGPGELVARLEVGPTWFFAAGPLVEHEHAEAALATADQCDVRWLNDYSERAAPTGEVPGNPGLRWFRASSVPHGLDLAHAHLHVWNANGDWQGVGAVRRLEGVQDDELVIEWLHCGGVRAVVHDSDGEPVPDHYVHLEHDHRRVGDATQPYRTACRTDAQGRAHLTHVPPGPVTLHVRSESIPEARFAANVVAGADTSIDLVVDRRTRGGTISGIVTTASGAPFRGCNVLLTSRLDTSIWRNAQLDWQERDGRFVGVFELKDVPVVECNLTLNTFYPCSVAMTHLQATAPASDLAFHIDDRCEIAIVRIAPVDSGGAPVNDVAVELTGPGWQSTYRLRDSDDAPAMFEVPVGQTIDWQVLGAGVRRCRGTLQVAADGHDLTVPTTPGFSTRISTMQMPGYHDVPGVGVLADGNTVGFTDERGDLVLDLETPPLTLGFAPGQWRIYSTSSHVSRIQADGSFSFEVPGRLAVYLTSTR